MYSCLQAFNFVTALNPFGPTFDDDNQQDVKKRPRGPTQKAMDPVSRPTEYLGTSKGFGFTKKNELFVGRVAMLVRDSPRNSVPSPRNSKL